MDQLNSMAPLAGAIYWLLSEWRHEQRNKNQKEAEYFIYVLWLITERQKRRKVNVILK